MLNEYLIESVEVTDFITAVGEVFMANQGIVHSIANDLNVPEYLQEDFFQIAYFALLDAVSVYRKNRKYSLLAYYRRCLLNAKFNLMLESGCAIKLTRRGYEKLRDKGEAIFTVEYNDSIGLKYTEKAFEERERRLLDKRLWEIVRTSVTDDEWLLLQLHFVNKLTYKEIAKRCEMSYSTVCFKFNHTFEKLKRNSGVQEMHKWYKEL